jgi:hypothetical protein
MDAGHAGEVPVERVEVELEPILVLRLGCGFFGFVSEAHRAPGQDRRESRRVGLDEKPVEDGCEQDPSHPKEKQDG